MISENEQLEPEEQVILLAHRLRKAREAKGWSQPKLAEKLGTHTNTVAAYEKNLRPPTLLLVLKCCRLLGITAADLLDETLPD